MWFFIDSSHDISICIFSIFTLIPCFHCYNRFGTSTQSWLYALTNSGITVRKGVIDHSLPRAVRRLCSARARLIYCCQPSSAPHWRRREGAHLLTYGRVMGFFSWPTTHGDLLRVHGGVPFTSLLSLPFPNAFMPVILDMLIEAYLCNFEIARIVAAGLHKSSILTSDIPGICLYARRYTAGILFNSVL